MIAAIYASNHRANQRERGEGVIHDTHGILRASIRRKGSGWRRGRRTDSYAMPAGEERQIL